jgi:hypothetical protein
MQHAPLKNLRDAAAFLATSERTLWGLTYPRGPIPCVRIGRSVRYSLAALEKFIQAQEAKPETAPSKG